MWEFDEAVEVHSVVVDGTETPDQFLWRGRLWRVCSIQSHWTESAVWWERGIIGPAPTYEGHPNHWTHAERTPTTPQPALSGAAASGAHAGASGCGGAYSGRSVPGGAAARAHQNGAAASANPRSLADCVAALAPGGSAALAPAGSPTADLHTDTAGGEPARGLSGSPAAVGVLDADWGPRRGVYRVEAGCGRHGRQELFDLAHDPDSGRWQLERVTDR